MSISIYPPIQACASVEECQDEQFTGGDIARMGEQAYMDYTGYFSIILTLVLNIRMISAINIRGRQLLYHDITDNCWGYTQAPNNEC